MKKAGLSTFSLNTHWDTVFNMRPRPDNTAVDVNVTDGGRKACDWRLP